MIVPLILNQSLNTKINPSSITIRSLKNHQINNSIYKYQGRFIKIYQKKNHSFQIISQNMEDKNNTLTLKFTSLEPGWHFMDFKTQLSSFTHFLILQQELKHHHGCITNIKIYLEYDRKNQLVYDSFQKIGQKISSMDPNKLANTKEINLYYEFDNGYEWPLLSF